MRLLCRLGLHTPARYFHVIAGRYTLHCKHCGKETT